MFKRKFPFTPLQKLKQLFWPDMGWIRAIKYSYLRIARLSDTSHKIAAGLACGVAISFTPLIGTHFIQAGLIAWFLRANLLSSLVGTFVGNPITFPFMWYFAYSFGAIILGIFGFSVESTPPDVEMTYNFLTSIISNKFESVFIPWLLGGYLCAILSWPLSYALFYKAVRGAKTARKQAKLLRMKRFAKEVTRPH